MTRRFTLLTLASGRLTPLSQTALVFSLTLFAAMIFLVRPVHEAAPRLKLVCPSAMVLGSQSPWVERALLQESSSLYMPSVQVDGRSGDVAQPDASPFSAFAPELQHDPAKALSIPSEQSSARWLTIDEAFPLVDQEPFLTLGQKAHALTLRTRQVQIQVFSDLYENVFKKDFVASDPEPLNAKSLTVSNLKGLKPLEMRLGIDTYGVQAKPFLLRSSGDAAWDRSVLEWAAKLPWVTWLKPGSYRVVVGP
jgi:hypothetical protein